MKLRIISLLLISSLCVLLLASCTTAGTDDTSTNISIGDVLNAGSKGLEYEVNENNPQTCTVTGIGTCTDKTVKIPTSIDGKMVTAVAPGAFAPSESTPKPVPKRMMRGDTARTAANSTDVSDSDISVKPSVNTEEQNEVLLALEGVTFPFTVKEIGEEAFLGCENLETITTTQSITSIGKDAFKDTAYYNNEENWENHALYLQSYLITVDSSYTGEFTVKHGTTGIADQAFYQCVNVTGVNMAESVTYTGSFTFYGCTNLTFVNGSANITYGAGSFDGCISYKDFFPGFGGGTENGQPIEPEASNRYQEIDKNTFDSLKALPKEYVSVTRYNETERVITYKVNEHGFHYTDEIGGEIVTELYGMNDENGTNVFMRKDGKWYRTTATAPKQEYYIPSGIELDMLVMYDEETLLYAYHEGDDSNRIEFGFKNGHVEYIGYITQEAEIKTVFSDYGFAILPDFSNADLVPDVILDHNENPI